jgi:hypothetical protein
MVRFLKVTWAFILSAIELGCLSPHAVVPTSNDASDAAMQVDGTSPASSACAHLRALGCPLGNSPNCAAVFNLDPKFGADPQCVVAATSIAALAACNVTCQP